MPAVGSPMQFGGDVGGQAHKSFLLLLCIRLKYARHVIFHFLVACADAVRLQLPRLKTAWEKKLCKHKKTLIRVHLYVTVRRMASSTFYPKSMAKLEYIREKPVKQPEFTHNLIPTFILGSKSSQNRTVLGRTDTDRI